MGGTAAVSLGDGASRARASPVGRVVFALPRLTLAAVVALVGCGGREASSAPLADAGDAQAVSDVGSRIRRRRRGLRRALAGAGVLDTDIPTHGQRWVEL